MRGLVPRIHAFVSMRGRKTWMPGMKPGMTKRANKNPGAKAGVFGFFIRARDQYFATTGALPHGSPPKR